MKKNMINTENIEGYLYETNLTLRTVQDPKSPNYGKEFINGEVSVATDEAGLNVLTVHYTYVTEMTKAEKPNITYGNLKRLMSAKTWVNDGKDEATLVRLVPSLALNDFYPQGNDQLVTQMRNEGGFVNIVNNINSDEKLRRKFTFDIVITGVDLIEVNDEQVARIKGAIFNFRGDLLPVTLVAKDSVVPGSVNYFVSLEPSNSNPVFTKVWGEIVNTTIKVEKVVESAFGSSVEISDRPQREWVVTGASPNPYEFGLQETITPEDLATAIANRNVYLQNVKTRAAEYYANKNATPASAISAPASNNTVPTGKFNFVL